MECHLLTNVSRPVAVVLFPSCLGGFASRSEKFYPAIWCKIPFLEIGFHGNGGSSANTLVKPYACGRELDLSICMQDWALTEDS